MAESIKSINFNGLYSISPSIAQRITGLSVGDEIDPRAIDDALVSLYSQGNFLDAYVTNDNGKITFHVKEKIRVAQLVINGYGDEKERDSLYSKLPLQKGQVYDEVRLANTKAILLSILESKGQYGSTIRVLEHQINPQAISVVLDINKGGNILITNAIYDGAQSLDVDTIESLSANKHRQSFAWFYGRNDGRLHAGELARDALRISDVYRRNGFLDVQVSSPFLEADLFTNKARLYYKITEGARYKVSSVEIKQSKEVKSPSQLKKLTNKLESRSGSYVDVEKIRNDINIIRSSYAEDAYAFTQVDPDTIKNSKDSTVKIVYKVTPGESVVKIRDVIVTGNTKTDDNVIRREITLAPGDVYSPFAINDSQNALRRLGIFKSVNIQQQQVSPTLLDLIINVVDGDSGQIQGSIAGGNSGASISASISERNILGTGQAGNFSVSLNGSSRAVLDSNGSPVKYKNGDAKSEFAVQSYSVSLGLTNPHLLDSKNSIGFNLSASTSIDSAYSTDTYNFGFDIGRSLSDHLKVGLGYDLTILNTYHFISPLYFTYFSGKNTFRTIGGNRFNGIWDRDYHLPITSSITPSIAFDNTDDFYFPKNGVIASAYAQFSGIGGNVYNTKIQGRFAYYYYFPKIDVIARLKINSGTLIRYRSGDYFPLSSTFQMGGIGTVRGYNNGDLSPRDNFGLRIGGDGLYTATTELSYGLGQSVRAITFFDYGALTYHGKRPEFSGFSSGEFKEYGILGSKTTSYQSIVRGSAGLGIEWISPIGPIGFMYTLCRFHQPDGLSYGTSCIFSDKKFGDGDNFEFNIGNRF